MLANFPLNEWFSAIWRLVHRWWHSSLRRTLGPSSNPVLALRYVKGRPERRSHCLFYLCTYSQPPRLKAVKVRTMSCTFLYLWQLRCKKCSFKYLWSKWKRLWIPQVVVAEPGSEFGKSILLLSVLFFLTPYRSECKKNRIKSHQLGVGGGREWETGLRLEAGQIQ